MSELPTGGVQWGMGSARTLQTSVSYSPTGHGAKPYHFLGSHPTKDKMPSPKQERPVKACPLLLGLAPTPQCLFAFTLDFGYSREPDRMFALRGQGSVALALHPPCPTGSWATGETMQGV